MEPTIETKFDSQEEKSHTVKIVLVGNSKVGKTTLLEALTGTGIEGRGYSASLEIPIKKENSQRVKLIGRIYDLRSQRYFPYLHSLFYYGAKGGIIVFDVTERESFQAISKWHNIIIGHSGNIPLLICGNKSDLRQDNQDHVSMKEAVNFAKKLSKDQNFGIPYIEISALKSIVAFHANELSDDNIEDIYPTIDAFRQPFVNWLIEIVKEHEDLGKL
ncbi:MAG: GTP-binding protein [Candidatus Heimdallarchaeota archaeon]|nr:GTP-binding protein [Candidatus Heimdallarchaeota archaeon]